MFRTLAFLSLSALSTALNAQVPSGNPGGMAPDTPGIDAGKPQPHANTADLTFLKQAALGGRAEVETANMAEQRALSADVKTFAKRMLSDHGKANEELMPLAKSNALSLPRELDKDHVVMRNELSSLRGDAFDRAYLRAQIMDHQKTAQLLEYEIGAGQNAKVIAFAQNQLPTVLDHLEHAQRLLVQLTNSTRSG
jgi:putative membrane protein